MSTYWWVPQPSLPPALLTEQQEFAAVSIELSQTDAELVDGGPVAVLMQQCRELLDLLRGQLGAQLWERAEQGRGLGTVWLGPHPAMARAALVQWAWMNTHVSKC
jgi:hypothetical protein